MATIKKRNNWVVWKDVIFALFIREIRTGFNDKFGISWAIFSPFIFIFALSLIRGLMNGSVTHNMPTFSFMVYGMIMIQLFLKILTSTSNSINKNKALFAFRQVQPISSWLAISLFEGLMKVAVMVMIWIIMYVMLIEVRIDNALMLMGNFFALSLLAMSIGLTISIFRCYIPEINKLVGLASRPLFFISGTFFSLQDIPKEYWIYLDWNPILHAVELSRQATYSTFGAVGVNAGYLWGCTVVALSLSLSIYYVSWRKAISR